MPPLKGFSDNPLTSRDCVSKATIALLDRLQQYQSPGGARIRIPVSTGTHFDETAAQLEGFARPLWAVAALIHGSPDGNDALTSLTIPFVQGLANGTNPGHPEYWGPVVTTDQRMVEMEIISFAMLAAPDHFYGSQTPDAKHNIIEWLQTINEKPMPMTNWLWFRVMTNLALIKCCGLPSQKLLPLMQKDFDVLDSFYLEDGWSSDGTWSDQGRQADYYSGSFAIQFSQLLYVKFAADLDPERCAVFRRRAYDFATDFALYFNADGAAIPFGRSLTYRFAFAGFWSAAAYAEVELPKPLNKQGVVKGLLLRHLRWWASKTDIFNVDGTLNIGFAYPNMYMCEDYNSPQSVYWCMKSFVALGLSASHRFWVEQEEALPIDAVPAVQAVRAPRHILCNSGSHHFLLSSGQFCPWPLKATEAKYGKFAYSSDFGFSVPTGPLIQQIAPDSNLALSVDGGDSWKVRWVALAPRWGRAVLHTASGVEDIPVLLSSWKPWPMFNITITTALIAPTNRWPDWHVRVHKVSFKLGSFITSISAVEGGFAVERPASDGSQSLPEAGKQFGRTGVNAPDLPAEPLLTSQNLCCVFSQAGTSGIRELDIRDSGSKDNAINTKSYGHLLKPDSNTNLMCQRSLIPTIKREVDFGEVEEPRDLLMAVGVFASTQMFGQVLDRWNDPPILHTGDKGQPPTLPYLELIDPW